LIKFGIDNPSKSEVIVRCGGDEKNRMTTQNRQKSNAKRKHWRNDVVFILIYWKGRTYFYTSDD